MDRSLNMAWALLYGEEMDDIPDPNKPENSAYIKATRKKLKDDLELLMKGPGKPLFEKWAKQLRGLNITLFALKNLCECEACKTIREMQIILKLWMDVETVLKGD